MAYHTAGVGMAPTRLKAARALAAEAAALPGGRCCTTAIALVHGEAKDPALVARVGLLRTWLAL